MHEFKIVSTVRLVCKMNLFSRESALKYYPQHLTLLVIIYIPDKYYKDKDITCIISRA